MWRLVFLRCAVAAVFVAAMGGGSAVWAESITYYLVDYPADQNGWTLQGFITTNGTIGALEEDDILAWSWTASKEGVSFGCNSEEAGTDLSIDGDILADATTVLVSVDVRLGRNALRLGAAPGCPLVQWTIRPGVTGYPYSVYEAMSCNGDVLWYAGHSDPEFQSHTIGQVPEPGAHVFIAALALIGVLRCRARREHR